MPAPEITEPALSDLPAAPSRSERPAQFATEADSFVAALPELVTEFNARVAEINAFADYLNGLALEGIEGAITDTALTMATGKLLGRSTASTGAIEEITVGSGLTLSGGTLSASGGASTASATEVLTGTDTAKAVTPDALAALWEQGSDIASAATISVGEGGYFNVTGTTTITDIDFATDKAGRHAWVKFAGALTLTNGANLILPGGANITTAAGDTACFISEGSDVVRCVAYQRASGAALVGGGAIPSWSSAPTAPAAGSFTLVKDAGTTATMTGTTRGVALSVTGAATDKNALMERTTPGSTWTMTALIQPTVIWRDYISLGLYAKDSATGRIQAFTLGYDGVATSGGQPAGFVLRDLRWTNITTYSSGTIAGRGFTHVGPVWVRVQLNATNLIFSISYDGELWLQVYSVAKAVWCANIDRAGVWFGVNQQIAPLVTTEHLHLMSFALA